MLIAVAWWCSPRALLGRPQTFGWPRFHLVALASLWNLLAGYAGLVSVGQQAFVGLGGYLLFALAMLLDVHPIAAIFIAGPLGALVAVPVAALIFRLRGAYFAIGTWVVAEVFRLLASQISVLGGGSGISLPAAVVIAMAPSRQMREFETYWLALGLTVLVLAATDPTALAPRPGAHRAARRQAQRRVATST
jgi:branched-chain amino acid transport system permease protein